MTWNGVHDYKKREDYTDQEWKKMDPWDNIDAERYWGKNWNYFNRDGGDKDWMKYEQGGGDKVRMWMDLGLGEQRDYQAKHGDNAEEHYTRANAGNFWTLHDPDNLRDYSEEAFFREAPDYIKERYDLNRVAGPRPGISGAGRGVTYTYDPSPGNKYAVGTTRRAADAYQTKQQEAYERSMNLPELPESNDSDSDSEFWDEVDERTPPPEDRNAGDIVDIIDTLVKERDHEGPININSNEVTADQANEWETIANIVGNDNVTDLSVDNKTTIDNENIFDVSDSEYSDGNAFNGNFTRLDVDQNNKWKTDLGVYGDGNITDASVSNIMDINNNNSYNGSGFSGWDTNDLIYEPEDTKVNIPENSQIFIDKWINGEKNGWDIPSSDEPQVKDRWQTITDIYGDGNITEFVEGLSSSDDTEPASYIRDASDIGTGFLERFKNKLLTKILDR